MGLPQVSRSHQMMRYDGGDPLKSQDHHAGLRALPLKAMECGNFDNCARLLPSIRDRGIKGKACFIKIIEINPPVIFLFL
jgi:hypothetical protein